MLLEARRKLVRMEGGVGWGGSLQPQLLGRNTARVGERMLLVATMATIIGTIQNTSTEIDFYVYNWNPSSPMPNLKGCL